MFQNKQFICDGRGLNKVMKIKILPEDLKFSKWIRKRDKRCVRCHSPVIFNDKGEAISHQASHYWSRGKWATRFDEYNYL